MGSGEETNKGKPAETRVEASLSIPPSGFNIPTISIPGGEPQDTQATDSVNEVESVKEVDEVEPQISISELRNKDSEKLSEITSIPSPLATGSVQDATVSERLDPLQTIDEGTRSKGDSERTINTGMREKAKLYPKVKEEDPAQTIDTGMRRKSQLYPTGSPTGRKEGEQPVSVADQLSEITSIHEPDNQDIINELRRVFGDGKTREFLASVGSPVAQSTRPLDSLESKVKGGGLSKGSGSQDYGIPLWPINHITPVYGLARVDDNGVVVRNDRGMPKFERELSSAELSEYLGVDDRALQIVIGQGGMGRVLKYQDNTGEELVVKVPLNQEGRQVAVKEFIYEGAIQNKLKHPNIVPVQVGLIQYEGRMMPAIAMKFVRGKNLQLILHERNQKWEKGESEGEYSLHSLLDMFKKVCQGVAYAHSKKIIHRDLKPENIMVGEFGEVLVMDWGLAKHLDGAESTKVDESGEHRIMEAGTASISVDRTIDGGIKGTLAYMSPEQALGKVDELDERTDVWALGCILYEILSGKRVISYDHTEPWWAVAARINSDDFTIAKPSEVKEGVSKELSELCMCGLTRDKDFRMKDVTDYVKAMDEYQAGRQTKLKELLAVVKGKTWQTRDSLEWYDETIEDIMDEINHLSGKSDDGNELMLLKLYENLLEVKLARINRLTQLTRPKDVQEAAEDLLIVEEKFDSCSKTTTSSIKNKSTTFKYRTLSAKGLSYWTQSKFEEARDKYLEAISLAQQLDDKVRICSYAGNVVEILLGLYDKTQENAIFDQANAQLQLFRDNQGDPLRELWLRGQVLEKQELHSECITCYEELLPIIETRNVKNYLIVVLLRLGKLQAILQDERATSNLEKAYNEASTYDSKEETIDAALSLAEIYLQSNIQRGEHFMNQASKFFGEGNTSFHDERWKGLCEKYHQIVKQPAN